MSEKQVFNIGDKVVVTDVKEDGSENTRHYIGKSGEVRSIDNEWIYPYEVKFENGESRLFCASELGLYDEVTKSDNPEDKDDEFEVTESVPQEAEAEAVKSKYDSKLAIEEWERDFLGYTSDGVQSHDKDILFKVDEDVFVEKVGRRNVSLTCDKNRALRLDATDFRDEKSLAKVVFDTLVRLDSFGLKVNLIVEETIVTKKTTDIVLRVGLNGEPTLKVKNNG